MPVWKHMRPAAACLALTVLAISWCLGAQANLVAAEPIEAAINFNRDIRPILSENCFYCHGQDGNKRQADLQLNVRQAAIDFGAIVPGKPESSSIIERIHATDPSVQMPPPNSNRRVSEEQKQLLAKWIAAGANYETHWAFVNPVRPADPVVKNESWVRNSIDRFVLAKLETEGLAPSPEADRATLIKRLHADLVGLPPTPEEVDAFVNSTDPDAYTKLVDRLLANPHYGERMALPWLDAARYADSNGFQQDGDHWQWIWRDWVVKALNQDMPFDQFTIEQLAGDLLPNATNDQKIASAFNRNHLHNGEGGAIAEEQRFVILFDRIDTTSTNWLGLTMACAQCHDHKYDPMTQRDYYSLMDAFNRVPEYGLPAYFSSRIRLAPPLLELPTEENQKRLAELAAATKAAEEEATPLTNAAYVGWKASVTAEAAGLPEQVTTLLKKPVAERTEEEKQNLEAGLRKHFDEKVRSTLAASIPAIGKLDGARGQEYQYKQDQIPRVMIMSDDQPRETAILSRGEYLQPTEKVSFTTPSFLPPLPADAPKNRLGLAKWLVSNENPLTARVQVNRMWQYFFGTGIVKTAEDFGVQAEYPIHGPLLDWLAVEFREKGWSMKQMHRLIVTSATYRQSSRVSPELKSRDIENRLYGRASRFRMPSMILRDWALASSGLLNDKLGGVPVYPYQPEAIWESLAITNERDFTYPASKGADLYRRSLYTFWRRTVGPANLFDSSNRQTCRVRATPTSTPLHSLTTLNDPTWVEAARKLAELVMSSSNAIDSQLKQAFRRVLARGPSAKELERLEEAYQKQFSLYQNDQTAAAALLKVGESPSSTALPIVEHAAMTATCLGIMNLDEALTRE